METTLEAVTAVQDRLIELPEEYEAPTLKQIGGVDHVFQMGSISSIWDNDGYNLD